MQEVEPAQIHIATKRQECVKTSMKQKYAKRHVKRIHKVVAQNNKKHAKLIKMEN